MKGLVKLVTAMKGDEITAPRKTTRRNRTFLKSYQEASSCLLFFVPSLIMKS